MTYCSERKKTKQKIELSKFESTPKVKNKFSSSSSDYSFFFFPSPLFFFSSKSNQSASNKGNKPKAKQFSNTMFILLGVFLFHHLANLPVIFISFFCLSRLSLKTPLSSFFVFLSFPQQYQSTHFHLFIKELVIPNFWEHDELEQLLYYFSAMNNLKRWQRCRRRWCSLFLSFFLSLCV